MVPFLLKMRMLSQGLVCHIIGRESKPVQLDKDMVGWNLHWFWRSHDDWRVGVLSRRWARGTQGDILFCVCSWDHFGVEMSYCG